MKVAPLELKLNPSLDRRVTHRLGQKAQLRALKFRCVPRTMQREPPGETTFQRILCGVDTDTLERALLCWQEQVLGPAPDELIAID